MTLLHRIPYYRLGMDRDNQRVVSIMLHVGVAPVANVHWEGRATRKYQTSTIIPELVNNLMVTMRIV